MTRDPHRAITDAIVAQIEAGAHAWFCPWHRAGGGLPVNAKTGQTYRGINILSLWCAEQAQSFASSRWATYQQWASIGAQVRRGAKGAPILFYKDLQRSERADEDAPKFVTRSSFVFNSAQVQSGPEPDDIPQTVLDPMPVLDRFVAGTGAVIRDGQTAAYVPARDEVTMPPRCRFTSTEGYAATLLHELVHWTGHASRLDRQLTTRSGTGAYAAEELIAELGSAFMMAGLGLAPTPHPNHAAYVAHWLPVVRFDPRALVTAAAHASRAAHHLSQLQPSSIETAESGRSSRATGSMEEQAPSCGQTKDLEMQDDEPQQRIVSNGSQCFRKQRLMPAHRAEGKLSRSQKHRLAKSVGVRNLPHV